MTHSPSRLPFCSWVPQQIFVPGYWHFTKETSESETSRGSVCGDHLGGRRDLHFPGEERSGSERFGALSEVAELESNPRLLAETLRPARKWGSWQ